MQIRIREGTSSDREPFWKATMETAWNDVPQDERVRLNRTEFESYFRRIAAPYLEDFKNQMFVAEDEAGRVLGHILVGQSSAFYSSNPYGFIYDIYVTEQARRKGVAKHLIEFALNRFKGQGLFKVKLEVAENNKGARSLYEMMGFKPERIVMGRQLK